MWGRCAGGALEVGGWCVPGAYVMRIQSGADVFFWEQVSTVLWLPGQPCRSVTGAQPEHNLTSMGTSGKLQENFRETSGKVQGNLTPEAHYLLLHRSASTLSRFSFIVDR